MTNTSLASFFPKPYQKTLLLFSLILNMSATALRLNLFNFSFPHSPTLPMESTALRLFLLHPFGHLVPTVWTGKQWRCWELDSLWPWPFWPLWWRNCADAASVITVMTMTSVETWCLLTLWQMSFVFICHATDSRWFYLVWIDLKATGWGSWNNFWISSCFSPHFILVLGLLFK